MKRAGLIIAALAITITGWGQKQNIQTANNYLKEKDYDKAIEYINMATNDPSTKDNAKAWFVRGNIYMDMQQNPAKKAGNPYREAAISFMKVAQLDAKYEKELIDQSLLVAAYNYYNDAAVQYNAKKYDESFILAKTAVDIHNIDGGKRFTSNKSFDTIAVQAQVIQAFSAYYNKKYDDALPILQSLKTSPLGRNENVYLAISDIYKTQNKEAEMMAILDEAKKKYPDNQNIRNEELNYYIKTGKQDILMKKLEEAVAKDPSNGELSFNLANGYNGMAFPKDANGKEMAKPANFAEYIGKAESAYTAAIKNDPDNAGYNYNKGVLYYNQATDFNKQMNEAAEKMDKSKVPADKKKLEDQYEAMKKQRDAMFATAVPYLEKAYTVLEPKAASLSPDDKFSYQSSLVALKEIYVRQNNMEKANELKKKLEESRKK